MAITKPLLGKLKFEPCDIQTTQRLFASFVKFANTGSRIADVPKSMSDNIRERFCSVD